MQTTADRANSVTTELRQPVSGLPDPGERVPGVAWPTVGLYVGTLTLFALELGGVLAWGWSHWITVPMGAAVTFLMFSVMHESTHHAISTNTRFNNIMGHVSVPFVVPWAAYPLVRFLHIEHHRNTNESMSVDPDAWTEEGPTWQLPLRWATIDVWYVVFYLRRLRDRPVREVVGAMGVFVVAAGGLAAIAATGHGTELLWAFVIPQRCGILVLAWWFDFLPHHGLTKTQREDKYQATRIRVGGERLLTPLFVYQNYHLVHHLHPSIPFYRYVRAWRRNEQAYLDRNAAISTWFGRSLTPNEYRTWRRLTDQLGGDAAQRPVFHPLRVREIEPVTASSVAVTFDVPADLAREYQYVQGQHITLRAVVDGQDVRRSYSLIEPVSAATLRIAVKQIDDGLFSTYVNEQLRADDILDVMTPTGSFRVDLGSAEPRHYVAVVAGSGITPLMSTIATTLEVEPQSRFTLIYGNRTSASTMFADRIAGWQQQYGERLRVHHVLSREGGGRITPELVADLLPGTSGVDASFVCGPQQMVESLSDALRGRSGRVLVELFHTETAATAVTVDLVSTVSVSVDGIESTFDLASTGESILDAARRSGTEPPYSCAGGACGTCRAKVMLGSAVMDQNFVLDEAQVAAGYVLTCQAHPTSDEVRLDYDA